MCMRCNQNNKKKTAQWSHTSASSFWMIERWQLWTKMRARTCTSVQTWLGPFTIMNRLTSLSMDNHCCSCRYWFLRFLIMKCLYQPCRSSGWVSSTISCHGKRIWFVGIRASAVIVLVNLHCLVIWVVCRSHRWRGSGWLSVVLLSWGRRSVSKSGQRTTAMSSPHR